MRRLRKGQKYSKSELKNGVSWDDAPDIKERTFILIESLHLDYLLGERLFFYRSVGSKARAYARTWGLPRLWQRALGVEPGYIIEVISKYFDNLPRKEQDKVLLHEITHIPRNFSGALVPHTRRRKGSFKNKLDDLVKMYLEKAD